MISALGLGHLEAAEGEARGKSCEGRLKEGMEDDADGALTSVLCCSDCGVNLGTVGLWASSFGHLPASYLWFSPGPGMVMHARSDLSIM